MRSNLISMADFHCTVMKVQSQYSLDAAFNAWLLDHQSTCLNGIRRELVTEIIYLSEMYDGTCIFGLNGMANIGKTIIACTLA